MRKLFLFGLGGLMLFSFAGCGGGAVPAGVDDRLLDSDVSRVPEVESAIGLDLPDDAVIYVVVDNSDVYSFSFFTALSSEEVQVYFQDEFESKGYREKRDWMTTESAGYSSLSGLLEGDDAAISIGIQDEGEQRLVDLGVDFK